MKLTVLRPNALVVCRPGGLGEVFRLVHDGVGELRDIQPHSEVKAEGKRERTGGGAP